MQSRKFRKSRKMRKQKKSRRGGAGMIQYTVSGMDADTQYPLQFNSSSRNMGMIKGMFINEVNQHKDPEPEDYDTLPEKVAIYLIRGGATTLEYNDLTIDEWDNNEMGIFIASLKNGDRLRIELITQA